MLESFRNAAKSWVAKVLMGLLVASFAVWGINDVGNGLGDSIARWTGFGPQDLVKIGDVVVSSEEFRRDLNNDLQRIAAQTGNALTVDDARRLGLDQQILDRIIDGAVLDARAEKMKLSVSDQSIVAEVAANPTFQDGKGNFDHNRFRALLQQNGLDEARFLMNERKNRLRRALTDLGATGTALPRTLTEAMARYRDETRDARFFSVSVSESDVPPPTDEDLKKQYEATPQAYTAPEYRTVAAIKVEPVDVADKIQVTEEEVAAAYEQRKVDYFTPEKRTVLQLGFPDVAKAEAAKKRIDAGEDFIKIATEMGAKESDITFADRTAADFLDQKIADAAFTLAEGQVSAPVSGDLTTALLKVVKISPEVQKPLADVRGDVENRLKLDKAKDEIQSIYDAVEDARASQTKFEDIAAKAGIPFTLVPAVSSSGKDKDGKDVELPSKAELLKAAFASDVGIENDALALTDGYVWYEVREVIPSALKPLADVKDQVIRDHVAGKLRELAAEKAKAIVAKAGNTTKLDTLATEAGAQIQSVANVKRTEPQETFDGMSVLALFASPPNSLTWALEPGGKSARVIEVSKVNTPAFNAASNETKALADDIKLGLGEDTLASFMKAARVDVDVSINEPLWREIRGMAAQN
ncbi:MAG: SurA N-terminal domain-containing protein [Rhizobiales bacterium]|nr:SurA N-terminal domain-containing protein [Hyphomicrobiales bacterium]